MASFKQLLVLQNDIETGLVKVFNPLPLRDLDGRDTGDHLSEVVRRENDNFVKNNNHLIGVLDFEKRGFTEPEDERDCWANNYALSHLDKAIPYLEKMNKYLTQEQIDSPDYTLRTLHLVAECLQADGNISEDEIDFMIEHSINKDYGYFGCKHHEYDICQIRKDFQHNHMSIAEESVIISANDEARFAVDSYCRTKGFNADAISAIGKCKDMGLAYGISQHLQDDTITVEQASALASCLNRVVDYIHSDDNFMPDGHNHLSSFCLEYDVDTFANIIADCPEISNDEMNMIVSDYIADKKCKNLASHIESHPVDVLGIRKDTSVTISDNNLKCKRQLTSKDGKDFYQVGISVDKSISESGYVNVTFGPEYIVSNEKTFSVKLPHDSERTVDVVRSSKHVKEKMLMSSLAKSHDEAIKTYRQNIRVEQQSNIDNNEHFRDDDRLSR